VDTARGPGSAELAAVAGRAPGEERREIPGGDVAGEPEALGAAALPGAGPDGAAGDVVVAARVLAPEVGGGEGARERCGAGRPLAAWRPSGPGVPQRSRVQYKLICRRLA
jgi:hypothetical protein